MTMGMLDHKKPSSPKLKKAARAVYHRVTDGPRNKWLDMRVNWYLSRAGKRYTKGAKIKVAFLAQMPEVWDKEIDICETMMKNDRFQVDVIVIPSYDGAKKELCKEYDNPYFFEKYPDAIKAYEHGTWFEIKEGQYDYVFYQRPYDQYLPNQYKSSEVVKLAKCCYVPYAFNGADVFSNLIANKSFFRNMYFVFCDSDDTAKKINSQFHSNTEKQTHHIENLGYPALIPYFSVHPSNKYTQFLWTPRWSYDSESGHSHFLEYKDVLNAFKKNNTDVEVIFRPHPLLFDELINKRLMERSEINSYLKQLDQLSIKYDKGSPIFDTFQNTDVLITDYSSIIIEFFITGRPIIYCDSDLKLNEVFQRMREGMYIAKDEGDVNYYLSELVKGKDELANIRKTIVEEYFDKSLYSIDNIIDCIISDCKD